ncbi:MAG: 4-hydroxy-tetrahydrodipicolinate reductase [Rhodanobacteraceae bacterium]
MGNRIDIAVNGAGGRMGQAVLRVSAGCEDVRIVAALVRPAASGAAPTPAAPNTAFDVACSSTLDAAVQPKVLIDFSGASGFDAALALARERRMAFVCGSTGLSAEQRTAMEDAASVIALLWSANFSLGVAALMRAVRDTARELPDWDCAIVETHHRNKRDAPSGTALAFGRAVAEARGREFDAVAQRDMRPNARNDGDIGFAVVRGGDVAGDHTVLFLGAGERIELTHRAGDRDIFARGAVAAARWIAGRAPGLYTLEQVG